jgi:hypothetical protein
MPWDDCIQGLQIYVNNAHVDETHYVDLPRILSFPDALIADAACSSRAAVLAFSSLRHCRKYVQRGIVPVRM